MSSSVNRGAIAFFPALFAHPHVFVLFFSVACIYMKSDYMGDMVDESADDQTRFTCFGGVRVDSVRVTSLFLTL